MKNPISSFLSYSMGAKVVISLMACLSFAIIYLMGSIAPWPGWVTMFVEGTMLAFLVIALGREIKTGYVLAGIVMFLSSAAVLSGERHSLWQNLLFLAAMLILFWSFVFKNPKVRKS